MCACLSFVGGGIGVAKVDADVSTLGVKLLDDSDTVLAHQVGAGVAYAFTRALSDQTRT
jgi:opacity protein-like surface antigen